jgi:hypothetical protein
VNNCDSVDSYADCPDKISYRFKNNALYPLGEKEKRSNKHVRLLKDLNKAHLISLKYQGASKKTYKAVKKRLKSKKKKVNHTS